MHSGVEVDFEQLLSEEQAAQWLNLSVHTLRNDRSRKIVGVPYVQLGRTIRYDPAEIRAWLDERRRHPKRSILPRRGRPTVSEREEARKAGVSVAELRRRKAGEGRP